MSALRPTAFRIDVPHLDDDTTHTLKDRLLEVADTLEPDELHLDLGRVEWISSAAIAMVISLHRRLNQVDKRLVLRNVGKGVGELLRLTRLHTLLDIRAA